MEEHSFKTWFGNELEKCNLTDKRKREILLSNGFDLTKIEEMLADFDIGKFEQAGRGLDHSVIRSISELLGINEDTVVKAYLSSVPRKPEG